MPLSSPFVSVLTPVFNGERYLAECIESVLAQTFRNFEYLIVDNRSTDASQRIAQRYAARDSRVRVRVNEEFLPAVQNWNHALGYVSLESRYTKILHADDLMMPTCLEAMVAVAEAHPAVGVVGSYAIQGDQVVNDGVPYPRSIFPGRDVARGMLLGGPYILGSPSATLLRSEIVRSRQPFYTDSLKMFTDREAYLYALQAHDFAFLHQILTFSRWRKDSIASSLRHQGVESPELLYLLQTWGPLYLDPGEFSRRCRQVLEEYVSFLGKHVLFRRAEAFWEFHRNWLRTLGHSLTPWRLYRAAAREVGRTLLKPFVTAKKAVVFSASLRWGHQDKPGGSLDQTTSWRGEPMADTPSLSGMERGPGDSPQGVE